MATTTTTSSTISGAPAASAGTSSSTTISSSSTTVSSSSTTSSSSSTTTSFTSNPSPSTTSSTIPTTLSTSTSSSVQKAAKPGSTTASTTSASSHTSPTHSSTPSTDRLANGTVAGIVVGAALGLALLTFLATFLIMRRQKHSKGKQRYGSSNERGGLELEAKPLPKKPLVTETSDATGTYENYLPQSADDKSIQQKAKATLDQIELHVENFYRNSSSSALRPDNAELVVFDSPYLPTSLASLLPRSKNKVNIMKHALAQYVTSSISPSANPPRSLLPPEFGLLPNTVTSARSTKAGSDQIMSRWRVMTAYLRPDPTKDASYIAQRDRKISETVQAFAKAFAPWKSTEYKDEERTRSLSAILEDAANLGIFLFSQPSALSFHWPASNEMGAGKIAVSPALVKRTDEKGQDLVEAQVMVNKVVLDA